MTILNARSLPRAVLALFVVTVAALGMLALAGPADAQPAPADTAKATPVLTKVVQYATAIEHGHSEHGWRGGKLPYSWGAGHGSHPGPSLGTCVGYTGSIHPCPADHTTGVDCSGFARWVYSLAFGRDVLGAGNTNDEVQNSHMHRVQNPKPGDLVFYGSSTANTHHVGVYIGNGKMIDALETGTDVETDSVHVASELLGYYHYSG